MASSATSISELDKKVESRHAEMNNRLDLLTAGMEEIRKLVLAHPNDDDENSSNRQRFSKGFCDDDRKPSYATRVSKVDFPSFDEKKMKEWLYKCDQFFALDATPDDAKVRLASIHLDGPALQWHVNYMKSKFKVYPSWTEYGVDVTQRFDIVFEDPLVHLIQVKQTGSMQEYLDAFELASTQVSLFPEQLLSIFLAGLETTTQMHVRMFNPTNVIHAGRFAKFHEASKLSPSSPKLTTKPQSSFNTTHKFPIPTKNPTLHTSHTSYNTNT